MSKATNDFTYLEPGRWLPRADGSVCFDDRSGAGLEAWDERDLDRCGVREDHAYGRNWCSLLRLQAPHSSCLLSGSVESCSWPNTRCRLRNWVLSTTKSMGHGTGTDHRCTDSQADAVEGYKKRFEARLERTNRGLTPDLRLRKKDLEMRSRLGYSDP